MRKVLIGLGAVAGLALAAVGGGVVWAKTAANAKMEAHYEAHDYTFPIPMPLTEAEVEALRQDKLKELEAAGAPTTGEDGAPVDVLAGVDLDAIAKERAIGRATHLVQARYGCVECHGVDFAGGTMIDDPMIGQLFGPNLTLGEGSFTKDYTAADWDRKVRHGVNPKGHGGPMPSEDFVRMSDQELSDIVTLIRSKPPVDKVVVPVTMGPLGTVLMAAGKLPLAADEHAGATDHVVMPPAAEPTAEFGAHLANVCTGCHRANFEGGLHPAAPPGWLPAANLTSGPGGVIGNYDLASFDKVLRSGVRPDGTTVGLPMNLMMKYTPNMTEVEVQALWAYLQTLPPVPSGT